jgi:hypothetical protein
VSGSMRVTAASKAVSMRQVVTAAASTNALPALTWRGYLHLVSECGSHDRAIRFLSETATRCQRPIVVNVPREDGSSTSLAIPPKGWSQGRAAGWIATRREELAAEFGEITRLGAVG